MKRMVWVLIAGLVLLGSAAASARVVTIAPTATALLPVEGNTTQAVLGFEVGSLKLEGARIQHAFLEWTVDGVDAENVPEFTVHEVTAPWDGAAVASGQAEVASEEGYADSWEIAPLDYERNGGFVRLNVTDIVRGWVAGETDNHGVLLGTTGVDRATVSGQVGEVRLVIRYGYRSN